MGSSACRSPVRCRSRISRSPPGPSTRHRSRCPTKEPIDAAPRTWRGCPGDSVNDAHRSTTVDAAAVRSPVGRSTNEQPSASLTPTGAPFSRTSGRTPAPDHDGRGRTRDRDPPRSAAGDLPPPGRPHHSHTRPPGPRAATARSAAVRPTSRSPLVDRQCLREPNCRHEKHRLLERNEPAPDRAVASDGELAAHDEPRLVVVPGVDRPRSLRPTPRPDGARPDRRAAPRTDPAARVEARRAHHAHADPSHGSRRPARTRRQPGGASDPT